MILNREGSDIAPASLNIGDRIEFLVIEHVAGVVAELYTFVRHLGKYFRAGLTGSGVATMLLNDNSDAGAFGDRAELFQITDPGFVGSGADLAEGNDISNAAGCRLFDPASMYLNRIGRF